MEGTKVRINSRVRTKTRLSVPPFQFAISPVCFHPMVAVVVLDIIVVSVVAVVVVAAVAVVVLSFCSNGG